MNKNNFEKIQSIKILSSYNDIQKSSRELPIGSISPDKKMKKTVNGWEYIKKDSNTSNKFDESKYKVEYIGDKKFYRVDYDVLLSLNKEDQIIYTENAKKLNDKNIKSVEKKESLSTLSYDDFKSPKKRGSQYKKERYIEFIEEKINAGIKYDENTMRTFNHIKKQLNMV